MILHGVDVVFIELFVGGVLWIRSISVTMDKARVKLMLSVVCVCVNGDLVKVIGVDKS